jgi:hypothetical protein
MLYLPGEFCKLPWGILYVSAGLAVFDQKKSIEATKPINTAFKICFSRRKNEVLNRLPSEVRFWCFALYL